MKSQRNRHSALKKLLSTLLLSFFIIGGSVSIGSHTTFANDTGFEVVNPGTVTVTPPAGSGVVTPAPVTPNPQPATPVTTDGTIRNTDDRSKFGASAERITADAALGDEIALLPGPNINFNDLLRIVITWSAQLAASVAIFIFVFRSFAAIQGTEESRNNLKSSIIKILIGLTLIFFSYQIISFVMGIIWATT